MKISLKTRVVYIYVKWLRIWFRIGIFNRFCHNILYVVSCQNMQTCEVNMKDITDNHKLLLAKGLARGERIDENKYDNAYILSDDATQLYANAENGHSALITLIFREFIEETDVPGVFRVVNAPPECHKKADSMRKRRHEKEKELEDID